jgi:hypothetical protein
MNPDSPFAGPKDESLLRPKVIHKIGQSHCSPRVFPNGKAVKNCYHSPGRRAPLPQNDHAIDASRSFPYPPDIGLLHGGRLFRGRTA